MKPSFYFAEVPNFLRNIVGLNALILGVAFLGIVVRADADSEGTISPARSEPIRIGFIGSLSGFAGSYGTAVLEGAKLAQEELSRQGTDLELFIEDDQSAAKMTASGYQKLRSINNIQALIGGSWWANSIVSVVEHDRIPFLSCETLYNKDYVRAPNYFTLGGDLRTWIRIYDPLVSEKKWRRGAIVRFVSGFADTLAEEMRTLFSKDGRTLVKEIQYSDIEMNEAATIATQIRAAAPDVLYIDAQPQSSAKLISRLAEQKTAHLAVLSNSILGDAIRQQLIDPAKYPGELYYTERESFREDFQKRFSDRYHRAPVLNADLGYAAVRLLAEAFKAGKDPVEAIRSGTLRVNDRSFQFDENNVFQLVGLKINRAGEKRASSSDGELKTGS